MSSIQNGLNPILFNNNLTPEMLLFRYVPMMPTHLYGLTSNGIA